MKRLVIPFLIETLLLLPLAEAQQAQTIVALRHRASVVNIAAVYDASSAVAIGANSAGTISTTLGSLTNQGLFLFVGENDSSSYTIVPGSVLTFNSTGLVPFIWQKVGSTKTGNGTYHGECFMATGATQSGAVTTLFNLTGTTGSAAEVIQYSFGHVSQSSVSGASARTCSSATSGAQSVTLNTNDAAVFTGFDTSNNRAPSGCATTTDVGGYTTTGYMGAHCATAPTSSLTWAGYGATSVALNQAIPHDDGSTKPPCAIAGYNPFTGGTNGTNAVSNLGTLNASQHGNNPVPSWAGTGTMAWSTIDTGLLNATGTLCGDLTSYPASTTAFSVEETGTGTSVTNNLRFTISSAATLSTGSRSFKFCTDATTSDTFVVDIGLIQIGSDYINTSLQCNGTSCWFNLETAATSNTSIATYTTGGSCSAGGSGWVTIAQQINEIGTGCGGHPCSYVNVYNNTGTLLGTQTGTAAGTYAGVGESWVLGHLGAQTLTSGVHFYFAKDFEDIQGGTPAF
jgi:hypothetical protein